MNYFIKRDTNEYGPYTLADMQKYVASGNILLTDLCRSEGLTEWVPVSQVIGNIPVPAAPQPPGVVPAGYATPSVSPYPAPPNLHWGICVLLTFITCFLFGIVWAFVQAAWVKKVQPKSKGILYYSVAVGIWLLSIFVGFGFGFQMALHRSEDPSSWFANLVILGAVFRLGIVIVAILGNFNMRDSIEEHFNTAEPIGLGLSGVMTFFFGILYFQYHFTKINEMKQRQMGYSV